ncbi:regulatory protein RecX [Saccharopolyspora shandongensis]|uniref:regulatory protein RecX n=1 Tax=Saccharopolyspora shandongensis TaxID=418495 RepID=UPI0033E0D99E
MQMNGDGTRRRSGARRRSSDDAPPGAAADEKSRRKPDDPEQLARDTVYRLLAARARSRSELRQALLRKEIDEEVADAVLQKFVDAGLVDDASFAEEWVHSRQRYQGLGRKALGFELRRKGVDAHLVEAALSTVDGDAEVERARELVQRKLRTMTNLDHAAKLRRLVGMLARKGYSEGLAFRVVREEIERSGDDAPDSDLEST